jgi:hypothetical protein
MGFSSILRGPCIIRASGLAFRRRQVSPYSQDAARVWPALFLFLNVVPSDSAYPARQPLASWPAVPGLEPGQPVAVGFAAASLYSVQKHRKHRTDLCQQRRQWRSFELSSWMFSQTHLQKRRLRKVVAAPEQRMPGQPEFADTPSAAFAAALCALLGRLDPRRAALVAAHGFIPVLAHWRPLAAISPASPTATPRAQSC